MATKLKQYRVNAEYSVYLSAVVSAKNEQHAYELAKKMGGDEFKETGLGDWTISDAVSEV